MAINTFVEIDIPEAQYLADLTGIVNDLESAKRFAVQLKERKYENIGTLPLLSCCGLFGASLLCRATAYETAFVQASV